MAESTQKDPRDTTKPQALVLLALPETPAWNEPLPPQRVLGVISMSLDDTKTIDSIIEALRRHVESK